MAWIELHQGLREHKKVYACMEVLGVNRVTMVGMLATFWLWALDNAQDGSLKGISNRTIARICDWPEKKADKLVAAFCDTGWLDRDGENLVIHDWYDYAGKLMEQREKDRERKRKDKTVRKISVGIPTEIPRNGDAIPDATVPIPYPTVPNTADTHNSTHSCEGGNSAEKACAGADPFTMFWDAYPKKSTRQREDALHAWKQLNPNPDGVAHIMKHLEAWKKCDQWLEQGGRFVPQAAAFLDREGEYLRKLPAPGKQPIPTGASGRLGEAELEAIQRMLRQEVPDGKLSESL